MLLSICTIAATLLGAVALAVGLYAKTRWTEGLVIAGLLTVFIAPIAGLVAMSVNAENATIAALETRYDITINKASLSTTPAAWRIDGDWYTCHLADPTVEGEDYDLLCGSPATTFVPADRL